MAEFAQTSKGRRSDDFRYGARIACREPMGSGELEAAAYRDASTLYDRAD